MKFNFKKEFGWSEIIAGLALIISLMVILNSTKPEKSKVEFNTGIVIPGTYYDIDSINTGYFFFKGLLTNNGDKTVSFLGIIMSEELIVIESSDKSGYITRKNPEEIVTYYLPDSITNVDISNKTVLRKVAYDNEINSLFYNNKKINPGESITLSLLITYDINDSSIEHSTCYINQPPTLLFSDNSKIKLFPYETVRQVRILKDKK